jgi:hypothetical protein
MAKIVQVELRSDHSTMVTWVEADKRLKRGVKITLKGMPNTWREIQNVYTEHDRKDIKTGWGMTDFMGTVPKHLNKG